MCTYIFVHIYLYTCIFLYIYIYQVFHEPYTSLLFSQFFSKISFMLILPVASWSLASQRENEFVKKAIDKHAKYTTTEFDKSRPVKKGAATRRRLGEQVAVNTILRGVGRHSGIWGSGKWAWSDRKGQQNLGLAGSFRLAARHRFNRDRPVLLLPGSWWSGQHEPDFESAGWWQKPTRQTWCKQCARCGILKEFGKDFHKMQLGRGGEFLACKGGSRTIKTHSSHWSAWFSPMQTRGMLADQTTSKAATLLWR